MILLLAFVFKFTFAEELAACDSKIYCDGPLLHAVQTAKLFPDSKTFVDMHMTDTPENVMAAFNLLPNHNKTTLQGFVSQYFTGPGEELEKWDPPDFVKLPSFLNGVKDSLLKDFGWDLCRIWKDLGRKIKDDVKKNPKRYSMIYLPHPFIVPGGRFRETFYWDSYWVVKGLLICEMNTTVKGMLENFVYYMKTYGLVPNGGRVYFTRRSQPPFLIPMVYEYYKATGNIEFIRQNIETLEAEYNFWQNNRSVSIEYDDKTYSLNQYRSNVVKPRPESYSEDLQTANLLNSVDRPSLYSNLISACESGWDFSSRWFAREGNTKLTLDTIETMSIVPVDLNSILCKNEWLLKEFYSILGNNKKASQYNMKYEKRKEAIQAILYNTESGIWHDYSLKTNRSRSYFYMSNIFPVYMDCVDLTEKIKDKILQYLKKNGVPDFKGGVPTSLDETGQQWDYPNAWSPLEQIMTWSLQSIPQTKDIATNLAENWMKSNYMGWQRTRGMFEKYNVKHPGTRGGGGEYDIQEGFGWTNGVALEILKRYGASLDISDEKGGCTSAASNNIVEIILTILTLFCSCRVCMI